MNNLYHFVATIFFTYFFIFVFKLLIGNTRFNRFKEVKYVLVISIIDTLLINLTMKSFELWIYYILLQVGIYFLYEEKDLKFFLYYILTFLIFQISDICVGLIIKKGALLDDILDKIVLSKVFVSDIMVVFIAIFLTMIVLNIKRTNKYVDKKGNKLFWIYINVIPILYMLLIYYYNTINIQNIAIISITMICFFLFISYLLFAVLNRLYIERNARKYIEKYNNVIEESLESMNEYKHDQKNILLSIGGFLDNNDIEGLKEYFYKDIAKNQYSDNKNLYGLTNIQNSPVKGLLYAKIATATSNQIDLYINIRNTIEDFIIEDIDMCKILGILIDNAIEASIESEQKILNIGIWDDESELYIIISNSFKQKPIIHKIFKKGYSTKGLNRGLGLSIVRDLIDKKYFNSSMNTKVKDDLFSVEITIKKIN